jgi:hypothetical protein
MWLAGHQPQRCDVEGQLNLKRTPDAVGTTKPMPLRLDRNLLRLAGRLL